MSGLTGISHVTLTVTDLAQARRFWTDVMGLELVVHSETHIVCIDRETRIAVGCRTHAGSTESRFDERNVGLDHLAFTVRDRRALERWQEHFAANAVEFTPIQESDWGWHLNVRAPQRIALELEVTKPEVAARLFGPAS